jgi:hypothetical protein
MIYERLKSNCVATPAVMKISPFRRSSASKKSFSRFMAVVLSVTAVTGCGIIFLVEKEQNKTFF